MENCEEALSGVSSAALSAAYACFLFSSVNHNKEIGK